jgi:hypothetical protein
MKKRMIASSLLLSAVVVVVWARSEVSALPASSAACSVRSLNGDYGYVVHGFSPLGEPFGALGRIAFDGAGGIEGTRISVEAGVRSEAHFTCAYTVNAECLMTTNSTCVDDGETESEVRVDGSIVDGGREVFLILSGLPEGGPGVPVATARDDKL